MMEISCRPGKRSWSSWSDGGMPVTDSSLALSWLMDHEGEMRLSDEEAVDRTWSGMSRAVDVPGRAIVLV